MNSRSWTGREASCVVSNEHEWLKWTKEIPYITFPSDWEVKAIPPVGGAIVRYHVKTPNCDCVSIYLDCYDVLGMMDAPYWEVYSYNGDPKRCLMNEIDELLKLISNCKNVEEK